MARISRFGFVVLCLLATVLSPPLRAANVTIPPGTATFASLDGSGDDADGFVDGVFTVHGDLTVDGTISCSDGAPLPASASACNIKIVATGNVTISAGGAVVAENNVGAGSGGDITIEAGGNLTLAAKVGLVAGGRISSSRTTTVFPDPATDNHAGDITLKSGDTVTIGDGAVVGANAARAEAGTILIDARNQALVDGIVTSGPSSTVLGTAFDGGRALSGNTTLQQQYGGPITINAYTASGPGITVGPTGRIVSQGEAAGGRTVTLEACGVEVRGLVASVSRKNGSNVRIRSGAGILIDGRDLDNLSAVTARFGQVRADAVVGQTKRGTVTLLAQDAIQVLGPTAGSRFAANANHTSKAGGQAGQIIATSLGSTVTGSGNAFSAMSHVQNGKGGIVEIKAPGAITLDTAIIDASGDYNPPNTGAKPGTILVRSYQNGISWQNGIGDVRPFANVTPPQRRWKLQLIYCTTLNTTGSTFPVDVVMDPPYPKTQILCGGTPPLPLNETAPVCNKAPVAVDDTYSAVSEILLQIPAPGVLLNDTGTGPLAATPQAAAATSQGGTVTLNADGSFDYTSASGFVGTDTFTYTVTNGAGSDTGTVTLNVISGNDPPVADDDTATVAEDSGATTIDVLDGDTDPDSDPLIVSQVTQPANGTVVITNGGLDLTYEPDADYCNNPPGTTLDTFDYTVDDGNGGTDTGTVTVTVNCTNDPPDAVNDTDDITEEAPNDANATNNTVSDNVLTNDTDIDGNSLTVSAVTGGTVGNPKAGTYGSVTINSNGSYTYTLNDGNVTVQALAPGGTLTDTFTYTASDGNGGTDTADLTVTIHGADDPATPDNDAWDFIGNTTLEVDHDLALAPKVEADTAASPPEKGVLEGDADPDGGPAFSITGIVGCGDASAPFDCTIAGQGVVSLNADGSFTFTPEAGDTDPTASFQYTLTGNPNPATVTLTRFERVWYVRNNAGGPGTGRSDDPFNTLVAAQTASLSGDYIFVYFGNGTSTGQAAGIVLKQDQRLRGQHAGLTVPITGTFNGSNNPNVALVAAVPGDRPLIDNAAGNAVGAADAIPTEIVGVSLSGVNAVDLTTNGGFGTSDALTISDNVIRGSTQEGIDVTLNGTGTITLNLTSNAWAGTSTGIGIDIIRSAGGLAANVSSNTGIRSSSTALNVTGGNVANTTITGFANNTFDPDTVGSGVTITNATFDADTVTGGFQQVAGGDLDIGTSGNRIGAAGMTLTSVRGDLEFTDLDIFSGNGDAVLVTTAVASSMTFGVDPALGTPTVNAQGGAALTVTGAALDIENATLVSANSILANGNGTGVTLSSTTGTLSTTGGSNAITNAEGTDFSIAGGPITVTYNGTIQDDTGQLVNIGNSSGTKTFSGAISDLNNDDDGGGIAIANFGTVTFSGGLTLSTGATTAFSASGTGTLTVTGTNTIETTTGTALNLQNITIGASNVTFQSINVDGNDTLPTNAILLNNTGSSGGLKIVGTGSAGSGGTIQDTGGDAISLTSTAKVSLDRMVITSNRGSGVKGSTVNGFVLNNSSVTTNGDSAPDDDSGVDIQDLTGTSFAGANPTGITNTTFTNNFEQQVQIQNTTGTLTDFQFTGNTITDPGTDGTIGHMFNFLTEGTATMTLTATGNAFSGTSNGTTGRGINADASGGTLTATIGAAGAGNGNTFTNQDVGVSVSQANNGNLSFDVVNNTVTGSVGHALNLFVAATSSGTVSGEFLNNVVGIFNTAGSGSQAGNGIRIQNEGSTSTNPVTVRIDGNTVQEMSQTSAVTVNQGTFAGAQTRRTNVTITNNVLREVDQDRAIEISQNNTSPALGGGGVTCANITGNTLSNIAGQLGNGTRILLFQQNGGTFNVTQKAPTAAVDPLEIDDANGSTAAQIVTLGSTITYNAGVCPLP